MLLTRLAEHAGSRTDLPPEFYLARMIRWAILIRADGSPAKRTLQDLAGSDSPAGLPLAAPYVYRSGPRPPAMLLADTLQYVIGLPAADTGKAEAEADRRNDDYVALLTRWRDSAPGDEAASAVLKYFEAGHQYRVKVPAAAQPSELTAIMVEGQWAHLRPTAVSFWADVVHERKTAGTGICLACGQEGALFQTIPLPVKAGAIPSGSTRGREAQLVSVNKAAQGRGGKTQLASAPLCGRCGSAAMSALNALLADRAHRYRSADSVLTWWLREPAEFSPLEWLNHPEPGQVHQLIAELNKPHRQPAVGGVDANAFYALTLSVNRSRVVVRDWLEVPLDQIQRHIGRWFADHQIADPWHDGLQVVPLWRLARATGRPASDDGPHRYLAETMPHGCERDLLLTALKGTRPPGYLLPHLLQRIHADGRVDLPRVALLRLILTRTPHSPKEACMPSLDPDAPYPAYQCGRMFALLEEIQRDALGRDVNTTIADKYLPAATTTPRAVLVMLQKNSAGHLRKIRRTSTGAYHALNRRLDEVLGHLDAGRNIPPVLDIEGQAQFILGYHHQRATDIAAARAHAHPQPAASS